MSPSALVCAPGEGNRENSRFKDVKLWLHLRDLICMNNNKTRERIFRLNFSHTRPAELSIMHLQSELLDSITFRKGCSIVPSFVDSWRNLKSFYDAYIQRNMQMLHLLSEIK